MASGPPRPLTIHETKILFQSECADAPSDGSGRIVGDTDNGRAKEGVSILTPGTGDIPSVR